VLATVAAYREAMNAFTEQGNLDVWYGRVDVDEVSRLFTEGVDVKRMKALERELERGRINTCVKALGKLTAVVDGKVSFLHKPPLLVPVDKLLSGDDRKDAEDNLKGLLTGYRNSLSANRRTLLDGYRYGSMARKVVGVGSVGTRAWVVLMLGRDTGDPLFLQAKEAQRSVLAPFLGESEFENEGQRVVEGQHLMQTASDIFLGWVRTPGIDGEIRDFYVRQLWDWKASADLGVLSATGMEGYARLCGWTLARAHARSGDSVDIAGYLGAKDTFDRAIAEFGERYADQNEIDYAALPEAIDSGQLDAETGW
jgi:hypothetical protein